MRLDLERIYRPGTIPAAVFVVLALLAGGPAAGVDPLDGHPPVFNEQISCSQGSACTVTDEYPNDEVPEDITADFTGMSGGESVQFVARALTSATPSGPFSSPFGSVESNAIGPISGSASVIIRYSFAIQGPEAPAGSVPVIITAQGFASATGTGTGAADAFAQAMFVSYGSFARADACLNGGEAGCTGPGTGEFTATWNAMMDPYSGDSDFAYDIFDLDLSARAYVADWGAGSADSEAVIDPVIAVDPTFANADQYTVVLAPGLVNGGGISEPPEVPALSPPGFAILALLLLASGLVGTAATKRRTAA